MILIDVNQVVISNMMQQMNIVENDQIEPDFLRHLILNSIRSYKTRFGQEYGDLIICDDTSDYWRQDIFPYYKATRKANRKKSPYDWKKLFDMLSAIKKEIFDTFPYKYIAVNRCEADDIIATLVKQFHKREKILIISSDKDFVQLFKYPNVKQYSPIGKIFLKEEDPINFLRLKIIRGDVSDGIPNMLSDDDTLVNPEKRQRRITKKILENFDINKLGIRSYENWERNVSLIDFDMIPQEIVNEIMKEYNKPIVGDHKKAFEYLIDHNLKVLELQFGEF